MFYIFPFPFFVFLSSLDFFSFIFALFVFPFFSFVILCFLFLYCFLFSGGLIQRYEDSFFSSSRVEAVVSDTAEYFSFTFLSPFFHICFFQNRPTGIWYVLHAGPWSFRIYDFPRYFVSSAAVVQQYCSSSAYSIKKTFFLTLGNRIFRFNN